MPFVVNTQTLIVQDLVDDLIGTLTAAPMAALLDTPKVHLYDAPHVPDPVNDTPASYTEASFTGYAAAAITLGAIGNAGVVGRQKFGSVNFTLGSPAAGGATIYGAIITDTTGAILYYILPFEDPAILSNVGDQLNLDAVVRLLFDQSV